MLNNTVLLDNFVVFNATVGGLQDMDLLLWANATAQQQLIDGVGVGLVVFDGRVTSLDDEMQRHAKARCLDFFVEPFRQGTGRQC